MRFVNGGPEIPDRLVQAHEDGRVVFFCGAGISSPAGLPGFDELSTRIYDSLGEQPDPSQQAALSQKRYDVAIDLLERKYKDRHMVRRQLRAILTPTNLTDPAATNTHKAILTLAKANDGSLRLVTTNFDRLFLEAEPSLKPYAAPLLPIPKKTRWNGLVHLHGLLPQDDDPVALNALVVSSGDFGLAYLTERWASRFVTELFRNYLVCFVGYSIEDPVLRYMLDALAADRVLGEAADDVFAFSPYREGHESRAKQEWESKGVIPLMYCEDANHERLHRSLMEWASVYRDGLTGKRSIIAREAILPPSHDANDGHIARVLWALSDSSGVSAKAFADLDPPPPVEWLEVLATPRFKYTDLLGLGANPAHIGRADAQYSLLRRPAPVECARDMSLVGVPGADWLAPSLDEPIWHLGRWICRHLERKEVLEWVIKNDCSLHPTFREVVMRELRDHSPPLAEPLAVIWRLICAGIAQRGNYHSSLPIYLWFERFKRFGWNVSQKREFLRMLRPLVALRHPFSLKGFWLEENGAEEAEPGGEEPAPKQSSDWASWEIQLGMGEQPWGKLRELQQDANWNRIAVECLPDFTSCLRDVMELSMELGEASPQQDLSYIARPSIGDHPQNNTFRDWTALIQLCRDAWLVAATDAPTLARAEFERWNSIKFPLFKRLVLHVATESPLISPEEGLAVLLHNKAWWLWTPETKHEALYFLLYVASKLPAPQQEDLYNALLAGPPREMFRSDLEPAEWNETVDHLLWLRLKLLERAGQILPPSVQQRLQELSDRHPDWPPEADVRDYFPFYMELDSGGIPRQKRILPRDPNRLIDELRTRPNDDHRYQDDWEDLCRSEPQLAMQALKGLGGEGFWNAGIWRTALQVFANGEANVTTLEMLGPSLLDLTPDAYAPIQHAYSGWLKALATRVSSPLESLWFQLIDKIFDNADTELGTSSQDAVGAAINNPVGYATEAIFDFWYRSQPEVNSGLPPALQLRLTRLLNPQPEGYAHARVIMARRLYSLFLADSVWTSERLLPKFDWGSDSREANRMWQGYLWTGRYGFDLLNAFKSYFLATAAHYNELGQCAQNYAAILTDAALGPETQFTKAELRDAYGALPHDGLYEAARMIVRLLSAAGDRRTEHWSNRVKPFFEGVWPKKHDSRSSNASMALAEICVRAGSSFEEAVASLRPLMLKGTNFYQPVTALAESGLSAQHPLSAVTLLNAIVDESEQWPDPALKTCLDQISSSNSAITSNPSFQRLHEYWFRRGREGNDY